MATSRKLMENVERNLQKQKMYDSLFEDPKFVRRLKKLSHSDKIKMSFDFYANQQYNANFFKVMHDQSNLQSTAKICTCDCNFLTHGKSSHHVPNCRTGNKVTRSSSNPTKKSKPECAKKFFAYNYNFFLKSMMNDQVSNDGSNVNNLEEPNELRVEGKSMLLHYRKPKYNSMEYMLAHFNLLDKAKVNIGKYKPLTLRDILPSMHTYQRSLERKYEG
ncbi:hypothetical protein HELRODRAFT_167796 [Helobdella robusta]|uniref:Uncharacterized protein n=1 Tax=Helobdella robusta TaxID=6412 RepID=T1EZT6_HELRO|nr:hypothetical protein HELRODRAFT_167796 [Helobdella robusta]ESO09964.1 hypothetical protein HELRODRAFT_167796 [Helobdella robusta]